MSYRRALIVDILPLATALLVLWLDTGILWLNMTALAVCAIYLIVFVWFMVSDAFSGATHEPGGGPNDGGGE